VAGGRKSASVEIGAGAEIGIVSVRRFIITPIPATGRDGSEGSTVGPTADPEAKARGDHSLPSKRGTPEGVDGAAPPGPHDTVKAGLLEPQSPAASNTDPAHHA
jgi:hypothetical protein